MDIRGCILGRGSHYSKKEDPGCYSLRRLISRRRHSIQCLVVADFVPLPLAVRNPVVHVVFQNGSLDVFRHRVHDAVLRMVHPENGSFLNGHSKFK